MSVSGWIIPLLTLGCVLAGLFRRVPVYDVFLQGAKEGLETAVRVLPPLVAMLAALAVLQKTGVLNGLSASLSPVLTALGIPKETAPLFLMRPFSGSASLATLQRLMAEFGADSAVGRAACALMGSSETVFYTIAVYLGGTGGKKSRYAIPCALLAWLAGGVAACWACARM